VLATASDGFIPASSQYGLFVEETRLLSSCRYEINGQVPVPVALSNIEQDSWLGYYIILPPGHATDSSSEENAMAEASQHSLELKLFRRVGEGFHEDLDLTNFSQQSTSFSLEL